MAGCMEQVQRMIAGCLVELRERRQRVPRVIESEPADRVVGGHLSGGGAHGLQKSPRRVHPWVAEIDRSQGLSGREEVVMSVDEPRDEGATVQILLDCTRQAVTEVGERANGRDRAASHRDGLDPRLLAPPGEDGSVREDALPPVHPIRDPTGR